LFEALSFVHSIVRPQHGIRDSIALLAAVPVGILHDEGLNLGS